MQKLEKLESESRQADQVGRRALKRLEKEIQGLREELEATQARSEELEEKTKQGFGKGVESAVEEVLKRKQDKVAKIRALRGRGEDASSGEDVECEVRDFAPPRSGVVPWSPQRRRGEDGHILQITETVAPSTSIHDHSCPPNRHVDQNHSLSSLDSPEENARTTPLQESALISQLLLKIEELEATNAQIKQQQIETATKLCSVQRDAESIGKLYECLGDPANVEWEVVVDDHRNKDQGPADDTIRFRSLRRTLEGGLPKLREITGTADGGNAFDSSFSGEYFSTAHGNRPLNTNSFKQRKSVVGLFDSGPESLSRNMSSRQNLSHYGGSIGTNNIQRSWSAGPNSPALSAISLPAEPLHTLGSELGSEFGDEWGANAGNHHLRATSLADLTDLSVERRSVSPMPAASSSFHVQDHSDSSTVMQVILESPTPERLRTETGSNSGEDRHTTRSHHRMSQTIRSRTDRWVERRFKDTLVGSDHPAEDRDKAEISKSVFANSAVDTVVETLTGRGSDRPAHTTDGMSRETDPAQGRESSERIVKRVACRGQPKPVVTFVLEIWLWLQFAMIILVFLWAMAKRGPKAVIEDAERKRHVRLRSCQ